MNPNAIKKVQPAVAYAAAHIDEDVSLMALARQAGISRYDFHRLFASITGETPKQMTLRLRLDRAAALLLISNSSVLEIALSCGFQSHEVFCRAFRRRFRIAPSAYRRSGFVKGVTASEAKEHAAFVSRVGPCVGLYYVNGRRFTNDLMSYVITKTELQPQPVIVGRRRVQRSEIAATIGQVLSHVFQFAQQHGIPLAGFPFTRYVEVGPGLITMEPGMRIAGDGQEAVHIDPAWLQSTGEAAVRADTLPGGPAAFTVHMGPYDRLQDAYGALQQWIESEGLTPSGSPWEWYVTDPAEHPNPLDWKTEVYWPLQR